MGNYQEITGGDVSAFPAESLIQGAVKRQKHRHRDDAVRPCHAKTLSTTELHRVRLMENLTARILLTVNTGCQWLAKKIRQPAAEIT